MAAKSITIETLDQLYEILTDRNVSLDDQYTYSHKVRTKNKSVKMSLGRIWFNLLLPDTYPDLINEPVNKKALKRICDKIYELLEPKEAAERMTLINEHAFKMASIAPVTFDAQSLILPDEIRDKRNTKITKDMKPEDFGKELSELSKELLTDHLDETGIGNIVNSGAKGTFNDIGVLQIAKGPTVDIEGNVGPIITNGFVDGLDAEGYYNAASEARRTYYIRAVGTQDPGYLARQTIFSNASTMLGEKDCKTKKYLNLFVKPEFLSRLIGRYYLNEHSNKLELITEDHNEIVNTTIQLRSPLYCKSKKGICQTCYGQYSEKFETKHIGLVAGSVINDAGIEGYAMKARHKTSQVNIKPANFVTDMIHI